ncbi:MAG: LysR family transcriptional regulator [Fusobacteriaceae bacterium]|jgi:DNA-binding transcriptional LysR family regulator|nr:LysR family transcriptional regulator [Fusobacteriaceae bacterium]
MDLKQLEYIVKIAEENNITHAAEKLFITQSALNQQLLKLEKELGTQLFYRSRINWRLTEAGKIYINNAKQILNIKKETYNKIYDCIESNVGHLSIGLTPGRGIAMFIAIFRKLIRLHPNLVLEPMELSVRQQQYKIARDELDVGFMTLSEAQRTNDNYIVLKSEEMVFATSKNHPILKGIDTSQPIDLSTLKNESFVLMNKESTNREIIDQIFEKAGFIPKLLFETKYTSSIVSVVKSSICCGIIPYYYAKLDSEYLSYFPIKEHPSWDMVICYRKGSYLSKPAKTFIELAKIFWNKQ